MHLTSQYSLDSRLDQVRFARSLDSIARPRRGFGREGLGGVLAVLLHEDLDFFFHLVELGGAALDETGPFFEECDHIVEAGVSGFHVSDNRLEAGKVVFETRSGFGAIWGFGFAHTRVCILFSPIAKPKIERSRRDNP